MKRRWWLLGLAAALLLAVLSPLASPSPDGLERVAEDHGFIGQVLEPAYQAIPDYAFPGIADERLGTIVAGVIGTLLIFSLTYGLASLLRRRGTG